MQVKIITVKGFTRSVKRLLGHLVLKSRYVNMCLVKIVSVKLNFICISCVKERYNSNLQICNYIIIHSV